MPGKKENITVTVKLFSGLDEEAGIKDYDSDTGFELEVQGGVRLNKMLKKHGIAQSGAVALFINGNQVEPKEKLKDGDIIFCMRPLAGG